MLQTQGIGWIQPSRLTPEASPFFAVPGGSLGELSDLITEIPLNGRLAGVGCGPTRECGKCESARLEQNRRSGIDGLRGASFVQQGRGWGLGADTEFSTDEQSAEYAGLAVGYLEEAIPRLEALRARVEAIGGPVLGQGWLSASYYEQFIPIQEEALAILEARPAGLDEQTRTALARAATAVSSAVLRVQNQPDLVAAQAVVAALTGNIVTLAAILAYHREAVAMIEQDAAAGVDEEVIQPVVKKVREAIDTGRKALDSGLGVLGLVAAALVGVVALGLYGRARG